MAESITVTGLREEERKARRRKSKAEWKKRNPKKVCAMSKAYAKRNPDKVAARYAAWAAENKDKRAAYKAKYYRVNKEVNSAARSLSQAAYYVANKEKIKAYVAEWRKLNYDPARSSARYHNRRARKLNNGGILSTDIYAKLLVLQKEKCACCRADLNKVGRHLDHVIALANGGENSDRNVQLLCPTCNLTKGVMHPVDFMQSRGFLL